MNNFLENSLKKLLYFRLLIPYLYGYATRSDQDLNHEILQILGIGNFPKASSRKIKPEFLKKDIYLDLHFDLDLQPDLVEQDLDLPIKTKIKSSFVKIGKSWKCTKCKIIKKTKSKHVCIAAQIECTSCQICLESLDDLKDHLKFSPKCCERNHICPECPKVFETFMKLVRHKVVHKRVTKVSCSDCTKTFRTQRMLIQHQNRAHSIYLDKNFKCSVCPKSFDFENHLKSHLEQSHSNNSNKKKKRSAGELFCDQCEMICTSRSALSYHMQKHNRPSGHPCPQCPKSFKSEFGLEYHIKIHNNEAHYLCDDCGKGFITPYKLIQHRRSRHTFEKPFICEECGEGFVRNDKLIVHKRRAHTGERPYACQVCDWRGVDSSSLIHHRKKHTKLVKEDSNLAKQNIDTIVVQNIPITAAADVVATVPPEMTYPF